MEIKIDGKDLQIDPKAIEKALTEAIVTSAIGDKIKESIRKLLADWRNPVEEAVKAEALDAIQKIIRGEYKDKIMETVRSKLTDELVDEIVMAAWMAFSEKLKKQDKHW